MHARFVHALACMMHASQFGVAQSWQWRCGGVAQVPRLWRCGVKHGFVDGTSDPSELELGLVVGLRRSGPGWWWGCRLLL